MSASTEATIIEIVFAVGALVVLGGLIGLIIARSRQQPLRPTMSVILCGAGLAIIALLLNNLLFRDYHHVQLKKNQYYEVTSLTANMKASLASSRTANQPISPQSQKASKNVTYLVKNLKQSPTAIQSAKAAQRQLTQAKRPNVQLVRRNYRIVLRKYFESTGVTANQANQLTAYAYHQATSYH